MKNIKRDFILNERKARATGPTGWDTTMDSTTGNDPQNAAIPETKTSTKSNLPSKPGNRPEDRHNEKIIDENFRKNVENILRGRAELPKNWNDLTIREQRDFVYAQYASNHPDTPKSLLILCIGSTIPNDCERWDFEPRPEWLDHDKFLRGQRFAMNHLSGIFFAQLLSLYTLFSFENGLKPLIVTGKSSDPITSFKRYLSTSRRVINWYSSDVWTKDTAGYKDVKAVRKLHANIRQRLMKSSEEDIDKAAKIANPWSPTRVKVLEDMRDSCPAAIPGQCPWGFSNEDKFKKPTGLNQGEMSATQFGFIGLAILFPERFGIHGSTEDDLEAFCHVWRSLGYLLGIEDEFNFCAGSLEDVRQRSRDFLEYWVKPNFRDVTSEWEHMLRCVTKGISFYFLSASYEHALLYLADLLEIPMPRITASLSYRSRFRYLMMRKTFAQLTKFPGVLELMNRRLIKSIERASNFTDEQLEVLQEKSNQALSKGIAETIAVNNGNQVSASTHWRRTPFLVFLSTCFLLKFPNIVNEFAKKWLRIDAAASLSR